MSYIILPKAHSSYPLRVGNEPLDAHLWSRERNKMMKIHKYDILDFDRIQNLGFECVEDFGGCQTRTNYKGVEAVFYEYCFEYITLPDGRRYRYSDILDGGIPDIELR